MTFALGFAIALLLCCAALLAHLLARRSGDGLSDQVGRLVAVHLRGKVSVQGVLARSYRDGVVLAAPKWLSEAQPHALGGELFLPRSQIVFFQLDPPARD